MCGTRGSAETVIMCVTVSAKEIKCVSHVLAYKLRLWLSAVLGEETTAQKMSEKEGDGE